MAHSKRYEKGFFFHITCSLAGSTGNLVPHPANPMEVEVALRSLGVLYLGSFQDTALKRGGCWKDFQAKDKTMPGTHTGEQRQRMLQGICRAFCAFYTEDRHNCSPSALLNTGTAPVSSPGALGNPRGAGRRWAMGLSFSSVPASCRDEPLLHLPKGI